MQIKNLLVNFKLYVILDTGLCRRPSDIAGIAKKVIAAGAGIVQLRAKNVADREIIKIGQMIKAKANKAVFILNDRVDLALILGADGVHLGQQDLSVKEARRILGKDKIIGISTHSLKQALSAEEEGADYIGIGPIYETALKPEARSLGLTIISQLNSRLQIPFVAIGGINLKNLDQLLLRKVRHIAICRAIIADRNPYQATKQFIGKLNQTLD